MEVSESLQCLGLVEEIVSHRYHHLQLCNWLGLDLTHHLCRCMQGSAPASTATRVVWCQCQVSWLE